MRTRINKNRGKQSYDYATVGTCSKLIHVETDGDVIEDVYFVGGCNGNTQGVSRLVKGMRVEDAIAKLEGIRCGMRPTSCPDQLAQALKISLGTVVEGEE